MVNSNPYPHWGTCRVWHYDLINCTNPGNFSNLLGENSETNIKPRQGMAHIMNIPWITNKIAYDGNPMSKFICIGNNKYWRRLNLKSWCWTQQQPNYHSIAAPLVGYRLLRKWNNLLVPLTSKTMQYENRWGYCKT